MNYTENYQLNQWDASDYVRREDFNEDNRKIEEALRTMAATDCKMNSGTYVGTGEYGQSCPNTLTAPFQPKLVLVALASAGICNNSAYPTYWQHCFVWTQGQNSADVAAYVDKSHRTGSIRFTTLENGLSWYTSSDYAALQLNLANATYFYLMLG